ncbi:MAG: hypothetical protein JNM93_02350 [Bacteriovoracaceae bacterium]|nr:hypothetical protein [Bacteriovoracaceae bacterium]
MTSRVFEKIPFKSFLWLAFLLCLIGDLLHAWYAHSIWLSPTSFDASFVRALSLQGIDPNDVPVNELQEVQSLLYQTIWTILISFMVINIVSYFLLTKQNAWGIKYTKFICFTSIFLCFLSFLKELFTPDIWLASTTLQLAIYIFVYLGFRFYPDFKKPAQ